MGNLLGYVRKFDRIYTPFSIRILAYNHKKVNAEHCVLAEGLNISPTGLSFKYPKVISKNDHLKVLIHDLKGLEEDILANITIVWAETKCVLTRRFGAKFLKIPPDKKFKLIKLARKKSKK